MKVGDKVTFARPEVAAVSYVQPFRRWVKEGRQATVTSVYEGRVNLQFDCARKPKRPLDYALPNVWACDLKVLRP